LGKALTTRSVEQVKSGPTRREIADGLLTGLYLVIQPNGAKSWAVRYRHGGRPRKLTLGPYPAIDLLKAREDAKAALRDVAKGSDPGTAKRKARAETIEGKDLFENVKADFIERHARQRRDWRETERLLDKNVLPTWRGRRIQDIGRRDVLALLDKLQDRGLGAGTNRVFAAIRKLFNWAAGRDIIQVSPCAGVKAPVAESPRHRKLSDAELRWLWKATERLSYPFGPITRLLLLTGQRLSEVAEMTAVELDPQNAVWTIPRERAKNDQAHDVPLAPIVIEIIKGLPAIGESGLLFTTNGETPVSGFSKAKRRLDDEMLKVARQEAAEGGEDPESVVIPPWRLHDLRRTAASGMARVGAPLPVIEKVLNHQSGSFAGIVGTYQQYEFAAEKRKAIETWAEFVKRTVDETPADNVLEFRAGS
jgi:integrase